MCVIVLFTWFKSISLQWAFNSKYLTFHTNPDLLLTIFPLRLFLYFFLLFKYEIQSNFGKYSFKFISVLCEENNSIPLKQVSLNNSFACIVNIASKVAGWMVGLTFSPKSDPSCHGEESMLHQTHRTEQTSLDRKDTNISLLLDINCTDDSTI